MKLGELFIELSTKGNTKELEKTLKQLKQAEKETAAQIKLSRDLSNATTDEEKALIKKNYAQKKEIDSTQRSINKAKEHNKAIIAGIKGLTGYVAAISLTIGVLDRMVNASAKANQSILTLSQTSGIDVNTINRYASAARSVNYNITREQVAQTMSSLATQIFEMYTNPGGGSTLTEGLSLLSAWTGSSLNFDLKGKNAADLLEMIRGPIQQLDDMRASYVLQKMGIDPGLLPMLRMSSSEFANVTNKFMSEEQMRKENEQALKLQEAKDELAKTIEVLTVQLIPVLKTIAEACVPLAEWLNKKLGHHEPKTETGKRQISALDETTQQMLDMEQWRYDHTIHPFGTKNLSKFIKGISDASIRSIALLKRNSIIENESLLGGNGSKKINNNITDNSTITIHTTQSAVDTINDLQTRKRTYQYVVNLSGAK